MSSRDSFHWLDYVIFTVMLLLSCGIGVYHACTGSKQQSKEEFLLGNRKMSWFPVALSLLVSYNSGIVQLGVPAETYLYGAQYLLTFIGTGLAILVSLFTFVPLLYRLQLISSYEYLELRFQSKAVRATGTIIIITSQVLYTGIATYLPAVALEAVTGFPVWASILCVGLVATIYTTMGGMKAVVWADAFQAIVIVAGLLAILIMGTIDVGGWYNVWKINKRNQRINLWNFSPSPVERLSFWTVTIGRMFSWLPFYAVNQTSVQRYCCVPTLRKAKMILLLNLPTQLFMDGLACIIGLVVFSYFSQCDPLKNPDVDQRLDSPNQLVPLFVMKVLSWPGIPGVFLAAICSGSLSTVSSCMNSMAAVTWEDLLKWKFDYLPEKTKTHILKILVIVFGVAGVITAFLANLLQGSIVQVSISFMSSCNSPLMGLFILGAYFTKSNWLGAIVGACFGMILPIWMSIGSYFAVPGNPPLPSSIAGCVWNGTITNSTASGAISEPVEGINKLYTVSFMWFPMIGILTTVFVGMIVSRISAPFINSVHPTDIKDAYLILPIDRWWCRSKNRSGTTDALDQNELKELTT